MVITINSRAWTWTFSQHGTDHGIHQYISSYEFFCCQTLTSVFSHPVKIGQLGMQIFIINKLLIDGFQIKAFLGSPKIGQHGKQSCWKVWKNTSFEHPLGVKWTRRRKRSSCLAFLLNRVPCHLQTKWVLFIFMLNIKSARLLLIYTACNSGLLHYVLEISLSSSLLIVQNSFQCDLNFVCHD